MHLLTLAKDEHTITVEFQHDLQDDGMRFTIEAKVKISVSHPRLDSAFPDAEADRSRQTVSWADQAVRDTVSWTDGSWFLEPWKEKLDHQRVQLSTAGGGRPLVVDLGLDFAGGGYYFLRVDVLSSDSEDSPAALTVERVVD
uniref:Probable 3-oxoacyl-[acyl-carrier-protein] reductase oxidoreductase (EC) n=1 Tax=Ganoderma boninense TaxID=34458 RepID=A0A5K1K9A5_9APHY|nr:Probable 3-oxoacyl-[acyl-carrier-protein] reductase oxidoreductase (EC [Ganoderma boninense]